jgi:hypothetical protein
MSLFVPVADADIILTVKREKMIAKHGIKEFHAVTLRIVRLGEWCLLTSNSRKGNKLLQQSIRQSLPLPLSNRRANPSNARVE